MAEVPRWVTVIVSALLIISPVSGTRAPQTGRSVVDGDHDLSACDRSSSRAVGWRAAVGVHARRTTRPRRNAGSGRVHRLPQLDAVSLGVAKLGEATVRIPLWVHLDGLPGRAQLIDDRVEVGDTEVDHPGVLGRADHLRVQLEGREHRRARLLAPGALLVALRGGLDPEPLLIPKLQRVGITRAKEESADARDSLHERNHSATPVHAALADSMFRTAAFSRSSVLAALVRQLSATVCDIGSGKMSSSPRSTPSRMARATDSADAFGISKPRVMSVSVGPVRTAWTPTPCAASSARSDCERLNAAAFEIA